MSTMSVMCIDCSRSGTISVAHEGDNPRPDRFAHEGRLRPNQSIRRKLCRLVLGLVVVGDSFVGLDVAVRYGRLGLIHYN